jgi:hypothetical protein
VECRLVEDFRAEVMGGGVVRKHLQRVELVTTSTQTPSADQSAERVDDDLTDSRCTEPPHRWT